MRSIISDPSLTQRNTFNQSLVAQHATLTRLSTGLKINSGADDPAGLISSENLRAVLSMLDAESRAVERADAVARTAEGALGEVSSLLQRAESLAVANASDGTTESERQANQMEIDSILQSVDRISTSSDYNGRNLLDGTYSLSALGETLDIESAAVRDLGETIVDEGGPNEELFDLSDVTSSGPLNTVDGDASIAVSVIRQAGASIAALRGRLGSFSQNTLGTERTRISTAIENVSAAESLIRDADFAEETSILARQDILSSTSSAAIGIANGSNEQILSLLLG